MAKRVDNPRAVYGAAAFEGMTGDLPTQWPRTMGPKAMQYLQEVVDKGLQCDMASRFERAFSEAYGVKHCIATPGCTPALAALAAAFDFEPGDEIIVSPITDYGSIQGLIKENYIPVFADAAPGTVNLDADTVAERITDRTRAILAVHKTGLVCDMDPVLALAEKHDLIVYEDACQAVFSQYKGRLAGTLGKAAGFSFDAEKTMGADVGGCVVTDDDDLAERLRFIAHSRGAVSRPGYGRTHSEPGYAFRMPHCTAAICLAQLEIIHEQVAQRDRMARLLSDLLNEIPGIVPLPVPAYAEVYSCWMIGFSIDADQFDCTADGFAQELADTGIPGAGTARYYLMPEACTFLEENARAGVYPYSQPPASRPIHYAGSCPQAEAFLNTFIRWSTFCERYKPEHCERAAEIVKQTATRHRRRTRQGA